MVEEKQTEQDKVDEKQLRAEHNDEQERKQAQDYKVGNRRTPLSNNILNLLSGMLQPQTLGFEQVNLDMSFSYLDSFDVSRVMNSSFLITFCQMFKFKKSEYLERSTLATLLNAKRSYDGKSMELFTTTITKQDQSYKDTTKKKTSFLSGLGIGKKE